MTDNDLAKCIKAMPRKIKIGAYDWAVVLKAGDGRDSENEDQLWGQANFELMQIFLWPENFTSPDKVVGIVLHECSHVIFDNQGLSHLKRDKEEREEQIVLGFEAGMIALMRDNPSLMNWMKKWLR